MRRETVDPDAEALALRARAGAIVLASLRPHLLAISISLAPAITAAALGDTNDFGRSRGYLAFMIAGFLVAFVATVLALIRLGDGWRVVLAFLHSRPAMRAIAGGGMVTFGAVAIAWTVPAIHQGLTSGPAPILGAPPGGFDPTLERILRAQECERAAKGGAGLLMVAGAGAVLFLSGLWVLIGPRFRIEKLSNAADDVFETEFAQGEAALRRLAWLVGTVALVVAVHVLVISRLPPAVLRTLAVPFVVFAFVGIGAGFLALKVTIECFPEILKAIRCGPRAISMVLGALLTAGGLVLLALFAGAVVAIAIGSISDYEPLLLFAALLIGCGATGCGFFLLRRRAPKRPP
jgi:hypothetical protein